MAPSSWLRHKGGEAHTKVRLPDLEQADWSRGLGVGAGGPSSAAQATFVEGLLSTSNIALHGEISALAVEPVQGYLAVGTSVGSIHLFGQAAVQIDWNVRPANRIQHLLFKSGSPLLAVIDVKDNISVFDLSRNDPQIHAKAASAQHPFQPVQSTTTGAGPSGPLHPDTPMRVGAHTARNSILCAELSPLHDHLFLGLRDGTIDAYDLDRLCPSPYRVPNLWWEEEEILRKSGVLDAPNRRHVPLIVDIKTHPKDINQLLLAYEGGVVLLDVKQTTVMRSFQLRHLPGAMGAGVGNEEAMWTERAAPATCVAWRPDGLLFACGHEDGCISIWNVEDDDKPVMVRTLDHIDVDKPDVTALENSGHWPQTREPIFKLAWSGFPAQTWRSFEKAAAQFQSQSAVPAKEEEKQEATAGTILTVLGGATERHPPGLACLHFPAFSWPASSYWNPKSHEAVTKITQALHASVVEVHGSRYATSSAVEDFILVPRDSPYYGLAYDPIGIVTLLSADPTLPSLPPPAAARGLRAFAFPPPGENSPADPPAASPPNARIQHAFAQRPLQLPLALSTAGPGAILGAELVTVSVHAYRSLIGKIGGAGQEPLSPTIGTAAQASQAAHASTAHLVLRGGTAQPSAVGTNSQSAETLTALARAENSRILITWHLDGTVRFADASPHLLLGGRVKSAETDGADPEIYLNKAFPHPLHHLTIDTRDLLNKRSMHGHPIFDRLRADPSRQRICSVKFAPEALELAIALRAGQVLHYKYGLAHYSETEKLAEAVAEDVQHDEELAAQYAHQTRSPSISQHSAHHELDATMAGALDGLSVSHARQDSSQSASGSQMAPPPRPRRDPKRKGVASKLGFGRQSEDASIPESQPIPPPSAMSPQAPMMTSVDEITSLNHLAAWSVDGFKPNILVELNRGELTALELGDIGFLAIASGPALAVVDLRGPEMLVREGFGDQALGEGHGNMTRDERKIVEEESRSPIRAMRLSVCRTVANPVLTPTLIVTRDSGFTTLWALSKGSLDVWMAQRSHGVQVDELRDAVEVSVIDMAGNVCYALPAELQRSLREQVHDVLDDVTQDMNSLLCVGQRSITLRVGLLGPRVGKADIGETIKAAGIVDRHGEKICMAVSASSIWLLALPHLQVITRIQRHNRAHEQRLTLADATISLDGSGDFVEVANSLDVCMWTVFATSPRPGLPSLLLYRPVSMPLAPNAIGNVASGLVNWIGGKSSALTQGAQFDEFLAGPKRPEASKLPEQKFIIVQVEAQRRRDAAAAQRQGQASGAPPGRPMPRVQGNGPTSTPSTASRTAQETQAAYGTAGWTADLARQRGEMMSSLEQGLSNLESGASSWMKSAREQMIKQAARDKMTKFF